MILPPGVGAKLQLLVLLLFVSSSVRGKPQQTKPGCRYEGKRYQEGDPVSTAEPCLQCRCLEGSLRCRLRVCPRLPQPEPVGCRLRPPSDNACCPELICGPEEEVNENILHRSKTALVQHRKTEEGCLHEGVRYGPGSAMMGSQRCEYCYCISGARRCIRPKCLLPLPGCAPLYAPHSCCPVAYNCTRQVDFSTTLAAISGNGCRTSHRTYQEGEMVRDIARKATCDNCFCAMGAIRCVPLSCAPPLQGCKPIVREGQCCPSTYNCSGTIEVKATQNYASYAFISKDYAKFRKETKFYPAIHDSALLVQTSVEGRGHRVVNEVLESSGVTAPETITDNLAVATKSTQPVASPTPGQLAETETMDNEIPTETAAPDYPARPTSRADQPTAVTSEYSTMAADTPSYDQSAVTTRDPIAATNQAGDEEDDNGGASTTYSDVEDIWPTSTASEWTTTTTISEAPATSAADETSSVTVDEGATATTTGSLLVVSGSAPITEVPPSESTPVIAESSDDTVDTNTTTTTTTTATTTTTTTVTSHNDRVRLESPIKSTTITDLEARTTTTTRSTSSSSPTSSSKSSASSKPALMTNTPPTTTASTGVTPTATSGQAGKEVEEPARNQTGGSADSSPGKEKGETGPSTSVLVPDDMLVMNVTVRTNVAVGHLHGVDIHPMGKPVAPDIAAILNITNRAKGEDYDYDYGSPTLPPSLPNVRIIPFVAADALVKDKSDDEVPAAVTGYPASAAAVPPPDLGPKDANFYDIVTQENRFSPPEKTEGGFVPREPPYFDPLFHASSLNLEIGTGVTVAPETHAAPNSHRKNDVVPSHCLYEEHEYGHGQILPSRAVCATCICYYGEIVCSNQKCPQLKIGCRLVNNPNDDCCSKIICADDDVESPTVVLDRVDATAAHRHEPTVSADPFRDVIKTEPAPDLPSLIGDMMMPYLVDHTSPTSYAVAPPSVGDNDTPAIITATSAADRNLISPYEQPSGGESTGGWGEKVGESDSSLFSLDGVLDLFFGEPVINETTTKSSTTAKTRTRSTAPKTTIVPSSSFATALEPTTTTEARVEDDRDPGGGLLKVSGCNIYGRMYGLGQVITELSAPCLECRCTDLGVQCKSPTDC